MCEPRTWIAALICAAPFLGAVPGAADPSATVLTQPQMRAAAALSVGAGRNAQALDLANALLARDAQDVDALVSKARALRNLGHNAEAVKTARAATRFAETEEETFAAAMVMAQALASDEHRTRA